MDDNSIIYRPNRSYKGFLLFVKGLEIANLLIAGMLISWSMYSAVLFLCMLEILFLFLEKVLCYDSLETIIINNEGLQLLRAKGKLFRTIPWSEVTYSCYINNWRNQRFLVLALREVDSQNLKRIVNKSALVYQNDAIVISMDPMQDTLKMENFIFQQTLSDTAHSRTDDGSAP